MKKTILFVSGNFSLGGLETHLLTYFKFLKRAGYRLYFLTHIPPGIEIPLELNLYIDKLFHIDAHDYSASSILKFYEKTKKIIEHYKIDIVHLHPFVSLYGGFLASFEKDIPTAVTLHGKISLFSSEDTSGFFLENSVLKNSLVFNVNKSLYNELNDIYHYKHIYYLANPIDEDIFKKENKLSKNRYVLVVSRLDLDKFNGIKKALTMLVEQSQSLGFKIKVVGEGNKKQELFKLFEKKNIEFLGYKSSKDVACLMSEAFAVGGMGRVALESLFTHTPTFLIGYDGIKGFISQDLFDKAKQSNFNGNNLDCVESEIFTNELREVLRQEKLERFFGVYEKVRDEYSSSRVVARYIEIIERYIKSYSEKKNQKDIYGNVLLYKDFLITKKELEKTEKELSNTKGDIILLQKEKNSLIDDFDKERRDLLERLNIEKKQLIEDFNKEKDELYKHLTYAQKILNDIYSSNFWKVAKSYYTIRDNVPPFNYLYKLIKKLKKEGVGSVGRKAFGKAEKGYAKIANQKLHTKELTKILNKYKDRTIVIFLPIMDWNIPLFQRPQHIAKNLAKHGILYFYCTNNIQYDSVNGFEEVSEGCYLTNRFDLIDKITGRKKYYDLLSGDLDTDWSFVKERLDRKDGIVYQYIDEISSNISGVEIPQKTVQKHFNILKDERCIVVPSATKLKDEVEKYRDKNYKLVTNGVEIEHFSKNITYNEYPDVIKTIVNRKKPIIGYFGAFASWFDYKLVDLLANYKKEFEVVLLGWDYDGSMKKSGLEKLENVTVLGPIPYKKLPYYASCFSVATVPFLVNDVTKSTSPIKLFEYMAMGKPIVTTDMPECRKYKSVLIGKNHKEFIEKIDEALELSKDDDYLSVLKKEAMSNSWEAKAKEISDLILKDKNLYE